MSEEGISVFNYCDRFPKNLTLEFMDFEWTLFLGFSEESARSEFLRNLRSNVRDCWYNEMVHSPPELMSTNCLKSPLTGELRVFVTEARNLGIAKYKEFLKSSLSRKAITNKVEVLLGFRSPHSFSEIFKSFLIDESELAVVEKTFLKASSSVKSGLAENICWSTLEQPAGEMRSMGEISELPRGNAFLTVKVCTQYREESTNKEYIFGQAE